MMTRLTLPCVLLVLVGLATGCAKAPYGYVAAHTMYYAGEPVMAEEALAAKAAAELEKDGKMKNLYLWDLATYQFYQGRWEDAKNNFLASVADKEAINSKADDIGAAMTSSSSGKYVGDPVEVATAYLYAAFCFYNLGDMESARIALRRCLEEDLSDEADRVGDLVVANYMFGEVSLRLGNVDDAIVAFRNSTNFREDFVPGMVALALLEQDRRPEEAEKLWARLTEIQGADYVETAKATDGTGAAVVVVSGRPSMVKADDFLGSFRKREPVKSGIVPMEVAATGDDVHAKVVLADSMHDQLTSQGGFKGEVRKQATRAVVKGLFSALGAKSMGPDTSADTRYWITLPGRFDMALLPLEPGTHDLDIQIGGRPAGGGSKLAKWRELYNVKRAEAGLSPLSQTVPNPLDKVEITDGRRTVVVVNSYIPAHR